MTSAPRSVFTGKSTWKPNDYPPPESLSIWSPFSWFYWKNGIISQVPLNALDLPFGAFASPPPFFSFFLFISTHHSRPTNDFQNTSVACALLGSLAPLLPSCPLTSSLSMASLVPCHLDTSCRHLRGGNSSWENVFIRSGCREDCRAFFLISD